MRVNVIRYALMFKGSIPAGVNVIAYPQIQCYRVDLARAVNQSRRAFADGSEVDPMRGKRRINLCRPRSIPMG